MKDMLKKGGRARLFLAVAVALACVGGVGMVSAQNTPKAQSPAPKSALSISPPTFELSANPGDTIKNSLRVDNISSESTEVSVDKRNFTALGEEGGIDLSETEGKYALASWIQITPAKAVIPPGGSKTFEYTLAIPIFAEPGGRFGSIVFKTAPKAFTNDQSQAIVSQEIGALIFVKIAGEVKERATVTDFAARSGLNERGPVGFDIKVRNEGNVQFKPKGTITVSNFFGRKVATIPVDAQNVLPDATRKMAAMWKSNWLFGKYSATLSLVYGNDKQLLTASASFWGFPYKLIGIVLAIVAALGFLMYSRRQRIGRAVKVLFGKE